MQHIIYKLYKTAGALMYASSRIFSIIALGFFLGNGNSNAQTALVGSEKLNPGQSRSFVQPEKELEQRVRETLKTNGETLRFMENLGQIPNAAVLYYLESKNGSVYIEKNRIRFVAVDEILVPQSAALDETADASSRKMKSEIKGTHTFTLYLDGANPGSMLQL